MRTVMFRGKRFDNGEWIYGELFKHMDGNTIIHHYVDFVRQADDVYQSTVGEYTGLQDKTGRRIFEGDIVSAPFIGYLNKTEIRTGVVEFMKGAFSVSWNDEMYGRNFVGYVEDIEVIGNKFDNPELVENNA